MYLFNQYYFFFFFLNGLFNPFVTPIWSIDTGGKNICLFTGKAVQYSISDVEHFLLPYSAESTLILSKDTSLH